MDLCEGRRVSTVSPCWAVGCRSCVHCGLLRLQGEDRVTTVPQTGEGTRAQETVMRRETQGKRTEEQVGKAISLRNHGFSDEAILGDDGRNLLFS